MSEMIYKYGIDFGTTNSSIALRYRKSSTKEEFTTVFEISDEKPTTSIPSVILVDSYGNIFVGDDAIENYKSLKTLKDVQFIRKIKMELDKLSEENPFFIEAGGKKIEIVELVASILRKLRLEAEKSVSDYIDPKQLKGVVMGVPVQYGDIQKNILKKALVLAGFYKDSDDADNYTEFVSEPVAVAVHYGLKLEKNTNVLVFDFGGGTLDIAVMNLQKQIGNEHLHPHETIAKDRITLGGEDFNELLFTGCICKEYSVNEIKNQLNIPQNYATDDNPQELWKYISSKPEYIDFVKTIEKCKWELSNKRTSDFSYIGENIHFPIRKIHREEFEEAIKVELKKIETMIGTMIDKIVNLCKEKGAVEENIVIEDICDIDYVLLSGGSSLIPAVQTRIVDIFGESKVLAEPLDKIANKNSKRNKIKNSEVLQSIVKGLAVVGCREMEIVEDVVDNDYGFWDDTDKTFEPIIEAGTKVRKTVIDRLSQNGISRDIRLSNPNASQAEIPIYQRNLNGIQRLGTITIENVGGKEYRMYMTIDSKKGILKVELYDTKRKTWMDYIPSEERQFEI